MATRWIAVVHTINKVHNTFCAMGKLWGKMDKEGAPWTLVNPTAKVTTEEVHTLIENKWITINWPEFFSLTNPKT